MNLTNQHLVNPKSVMVYSDSNASDYFVVRSSKRLGLNAHREILNKKRKMKVFVFGSVSFKMIRCPRGFFTIGSDYADDKNPKRNEIIKKPFWLSETEVSQELYKSVIGTNPSSHQGGVNSNQRPVEKVTWFDAISFCNELSKIACLQPYYNITEERKESVKKNKLIIYAKVTTNLNANGFRLPLEKEWEYASKSGSNNLYSGCNESEKLNDFAWGVENSGGVTQPIKTRKPNAWGFYDMTGNVYEWCEDFVEDYEGSPSHALRGGDYDLDLVKYGRNSMCDYGENALASDTVGFRIASNFTA